MSSLFARFLQSSELRSAKDARDLVMMEDSPMMDSEVELHQRHAHEPDQYLGQEHANSHGQDSSNAYCEEVSVSKIFEGSVDVSMAGSDDGSLELPVHYVSNAARKRQKVFTEDEPLVDTTAALAKNSKKTARLQKRLERKLARKVHSEVQSLLDFPQELILTILGFLEPSDIFTMLRLNKSMQMLILDHERSIADDITKRRYWVLRQCFPLPVCMDNVPSVARPALMSGQWQDRLRIHKNPYQHIQHIDSSYTCTCMSCVLAWNNLNIILDLAHWQHNLETREPIPQIPRGRNPEWNIVLLAHNAAIATKAMDSPLTYARILQKHLNTSTRTIIRFNKWRKKGESLTVQKPRTYHLTDSEAAAGSDEFLERSGPPSYQPIYMRDNYYSVEAFAPNRKWDKEVQRWFYYSKWPGPHELDLNWLVARFTPKTEQSSSTVPAPTAEGILMPRGEARHQIARLIELTFPWRSPQVGETTHESQKVNEVVRT